MLNRISYNSARKGHYLTPLFLYFLSFVLSTIIHAKSVFINVYLKMPPKNDISYLVTEFNNSLQKKGINKSYNIKPFIGHYPLHITLYLTHYPQKSITGIIQRVKTLAHSERSPLLKTEQFLVSDNGYVMLAINNKSLQQLSNKTMYSLMNLRDKGASIPSWAAADPNRVALFAHYGSPNVLEQFTPHCSIIDPIHLTPLEQRHLVKELQFFVNEFRHTHQEKKTAKGAALAVGVANKQGQIIKELATFPLNS